METPTKKKKKWKLREGTNRVKEKGWRMLCLEPQYWEAHYHQDSELNRRQGERDAQRGDRVTVLGVVCVKMVQWVWLTRQEDEDRWARQESVNLTIIVENESGEQEDTEDDDGTRDEREIWEVTHVTEEDFETNEGEVEDLWKLNMGLIGTLNPKP
jgi:hypothetical protein